MKEFNYDKTEKKKSFQCIKYEVVIDNTGLNFMIRKILKFSAKFDLTKNND